MLSFPKSLMTKIKNERGIDKIPPICMRSYVMTRLWRDPEKRALRIKRMKKSCSRVNKNRVYPKGYKATLRKRAKVVMHTPEANAKRIKTLMEAPDYYEKRLRSIAIARETRWPKEEEVVICDRPNDYAGVLLESDFQAM